MQRKSENGITLISLVITIIIMLILAGVVITFTIGDNGLIGKAKEAVRNCQNGADYEQTVLGDFENKANNIINSDNTQTTEPDIGKIRILEQGTIDTGVIENRKFKFLTANFQNTYTEEDHARFILYKIEQSGSNEVAFYLAGGNTFEMTGNTYSFYVYNAAGAGSGSARLYYWVIGGLEDK